MAKRVRNHVNPLAITTEVSFEGFHNDAPIVVDVGAYRGEFVAELAEQWPEQNYIALEVRKKVVEELEQQFAGRDNIVVFAGDAGRNLRAILEPSLRRGVLVKEIFVNFPDPWFKKKHHKRRFLNRQFLEATRSWLGGQTRWIFQTDQAELWQDTRAILDELHIKYAFFDKSPYGVATKWEKAKQADNKKIYRLEFHL